MNEVDPGDYSSLESFVALCIIAVIAAVAIAILWFIFSSGADLLSGGFRKWRHEWIGSRDGDCRYPGCWRRAEYLVTHPPDPPLTNSPSTMGICGRCVVNYDEAKNVLIEPVRN